MYMKSGTRNVILVLVLVAALAIVAYPRLFPPDIDDEFAPTENPTQALAAAEAAGQKVFLEFYSET
jgi:hypothetical protein